MRAKQKERPFTSTSSDPGYGSDDGTETPPTIAERVEEDEERVRLFGSYWITKSAKERIERSFGGVILPSLFTKTFGRAIMTAKHIPWKASKSIPHLVASHAHHVHFTAHLAHQFILNNLIYIAPFIALIALVVRFSYVMWKERKKGWKNAVKKAGIESLKTATKFFLVYLAWTAAIAAAAAMGILSGGTLPLGILFVGAMVAIGFAIASFITDKLPSMIQKWKEVEFSQKLKDIAAACLLTGLFEGAVWTLMDNPIVNVAGHLVHHASRFAAHAADAIGVSAAVAAAFFLGALIVSAVKRYMKVKVYKKQEGKSYKQGQTEIARKNYLEFMDATSSTPTPKAIEPRFSNYAGIIASPTNQPIIDLQKIKNPKKKEKRRKSLDSKYQKALKKQGLFAVEGDVMHKTKDSLGQGYLMVKYA